MGGAASTADFDAEKAKQNNRINELNEQLKTKEATIEQLEARLKAKEEQALRTTLITTPANPKTKARRGEISAEATNQEQEQGDELDFSYEKIRKDDATTKLIKEAVQKNILFKGLRPAEQDECVTAFFQVSLKAGETAISHGAVGDNFYVVQEGALEISLPMKDTVVVVGELTPGSGFGELALMYNEPRAATITAKTACVLWAISRKTFRNIHLSHKLRRKKQYQEYLRRVPQLQALKAVEIKRLADAVEEEEFEKGMVILREGERGDHFYIIVEGQVKYETKEAGEVGTGAVGDFFGHKALLTEETRAATVTAETTVLCLTMTRSDFVNLLGSLQEIVDRADKKGFTSAQSVRDVGAQENKYQKNIAFEDLQRKFLRGGRERSIVLGQGAFGKVQIVKHKQTGETYALKCLNKTQITDYSLEAHVVCERKVMTMIDHPFLLKLHNSYWDSQYVYFLLELCLGGELFNLLRKMRSFKERTSKFYAAVVVQAYAHLHAKHIVYRDLKPENLMLDSMGYIKVVDFGLAKVVKDRTWTICGTPDYLAPEIIQSSGHDKAADYWALGILIYEMTAGVVPFEGADTIDLYNAILRNDVSFPAYFSRTCKDLILRLLHGNQTKRLGNTKEGIQGIIKHRWFSGFDWDGLLNRKMPAPIVPSVESPEDTKNFPEEYDDHTTPPPSCSWEPEFPYQVVNGITQGM